MLVGLDGPMASVATVGFLLAHALYKATLFFCAGTVLHATGLTKLRNMGGLRRFLPVTAAASLLASLSMAGLDRKRTRLNSSHANISYAVFSLTKHRPDR